MADCKELARRVFEIEAEMERLSKDEETSMIKIFEIQAALDEERDRHRSAQADYEEATSELKEAKAALKAAALSD